MIAGGGPVRILSLSGGGFKGFYTAGVLAGLEAKLRRPLCECFDLVAGTSIGGILAIGVAAGVPTANLVEAMRNHGPKIFGTDRAPRSKYEKGKSLVAGAGSATYDPQPLRAAVEEIVGNASWDSLKTRLLIPALGLVSGSPQVFSSMSVPGDAADAPLAAIAMATAAAPTYFPTAVVGKRTYVDGGLIANAPELVATIEVEQRLGVPRERLHVASIGTTASKAGEAIIEAADRGLIDWGFGRAVIDLVLAGQEKLTRDMVRKLLGPQRYWTLDYDTSAAQQAELALDCASPQAIRLLGALAQETIDTWTVPPWMMAMAR